MLSQVASKAACVVARGEMIKADVLAVMLQYEKN
jgi:hypothetical protein